MTPEKPTRERLEHLIATHGADPARWPPAERAFAVHDAAQAEVLEQARALDALLDAFTVPAPPSALRRAVLLAAQRETARPRGLLVALRALWLELGGTRIAAPAFAMALAAGLGLGWITPEASAGEAEDLMSLAQFDEAYPEVDP